MGGRVPYGVGVDLGTTSVSAAVTDEHGTRVVRLGDRADDMPSAVYLQGDGSLVTGRRAASRSVSSPGRVARDFVRRLGDPEPVVLGGQDYTVEELVGVLLDAVLRRVTEVQREAPAATVLSHPVIWEPERCALLAEVAERAGFDRPGLVPAPVAVAASWADGGPDGVAGWADGGGCIAVYDLGGGGFQAAVVRVDGWAEGRGDGSGEARIIGTPAGERFLGGADFDEILLTHVDRAVGGTLAELDPDDQAGATARARVRQDCSRAKEALSRVPEVFVPVFLPGTERDVRVRVSEFESLLREPIAATAETLVRVIQSAQQPPGSVREVLLVGGSTRIPLAARAVSERLGRPVAAYAGSVHPVAVGAAILSGGPARRRRARSSAAPVSAPPPDAAAREDLDTAAPPVAPPPVATPPTATPPAPAPAPAPAADVQDRRTAEQPPASATRRSRRGSIALVGVAAAVVAGLLVAAPWRTPPPEPVASLVLTTSSVRIGESYYAYAGGFEPGEPVALSWTGPTQGTMGDAQRSDATGALAHGPVIEWDPPGEYQIVATGLRTGRTASVPLRVLPRR